MQQMTLMQTLFGFQGRIRRTTYWLARLGFGVAYGFVLIVAVVIFGALGGVVAAAGGASEDAASSGVGAIVVLIYVLGLIPLCWVSIALGVKRCHDRDKSGAFMLIFYFVPIVGPIWALIELGFLDGTPGPNQYGPSPKGIPGPMGGGMAPNVFA
ncbi:MAG TPA: DUF805 domain-containing protein [Caulobacteraceae bacterium]|nr:DUF805 domain-containing protein [Caulobacteraceae bacterium]